MKVSLYLNLSFQFFSIISKDVPIFLKFTINPFITQSLGNTVFFVKGNSLEKCFGKVLARPEHCVNKLKFSHLIRIKFKNQDSKYEENQVKRKCDVSEKNKILYFYDILENFLRSPLNLRTIY